MLQSTVFETVACDTGLQRVPGSAPTLVAHVSNRSVTRHGLEARFTGDVLGEPCSMDASPPSRTRRRHRGLGLAELLVALAISAAVLTAVAVATDASFTAYKVNQENAALMQRARLAMYRILSEIRTSDTHSPITASLSTTFQTGVAVTDTGIKMYDDNDVLRTYSFDSANSRLLVNINGSSHVLAEGVQAFRVKFEPMKSAASVRSGGVYDLLKRATITLTVRTNAATSASSETTGDQTVTISSSVMPRRNLF